jgi:type IV pilus assembly protein PilB
VETRRRLGEILVAHGVITDDELETALATRAADGRNERLGSTILRLGMASEQDIADALASQLRIGLVDIETVVPSQAALDLVPGSIAESRGVLPLSLDGGTLVVAMADPTDLILLDDLKVRTGVRSIRPVVAAATPLREAVGRSYGSGGDTRAIVEEMAPDEAELDTSDDDITSGAAQPIVRLANQILLDAVRLRASDVHIEPSRGGAVVRVRIDGILKKIAELPRAARGPLTSRLKIMGGMDIAERRRPQDGRAMLNLAGDEVDVRMSSMPSMHGETLVLRLLRRRQDGVDLGSLGLAPDVSRTYERSLNQPQGIVLVTGPTGSGKTTTLYAGLSTVADEERNVITLEDPVEYELSGVNQTQINPRVGLTFAAGMRSVLRQDPDVIMVGEIRDAETAGLAVEASMTGHLVLSTLHTNDALSTLSRIAELGVDRSLIASSLLMVMSQRLLRVVCIHCAEPATADPHTLERLDLPPDALVGYPLRRGAGCGACVDTGFLGRTMAVEALRFDATLSEMVVAGKPERELRQHARVGGMRSLREDGLRLALAGQTTLEEVLRVTPEDPDYLAMALLDRAMLAAELDADVPEGVPAAATAG